MNINHCSTFGIKTTEQGCIHKVPNHCEIVNCKSTCKLHAFNSLLTFMYFVMSAINIIQSKLQNCKIVKIVKIVKINC